MEYAAIIIPTLNRINHLTRCIESLKKNPESTKTDLYISVDFPPSGKFWNGYHDVVDYVKTISGFLSVNIYIQKKNLGPGLNSKYLVDKVSIQHDKYIYLEDDNEFSINFLSYMNWGLEEYKDDDSVFAICSNPCINTNTDKIYEDYYLIQYINAYGTGFWCHKNKRLNSFLSKEMINGFYKSFSLQKNLYNKSVAVYNMVALDSIRRVYEMRGKNDSLTLVDIWINFYMIQNNLFCVMPVKPKSRNWGQDNSGIHSCSDGYLFCNIEDNDKWRNKPIRVSKDYEEQLSLLHYNKFNLKKTNIYFARFLFVANYLFGNYTVKLCYRLIRAIYRFVLRKKNTDNPIKYG